MRPPIPPFVLAALLLIGMLILLEIGRRLGVKRLQKESEGERTNLSTIEGAIFALFGLVVAFTFSGAASRFNDKRMLIAEEVNSIEVAYLRLDLLSPEAQPKLRELFRNYVESRIETYRKLPDMDAAGKEIAQSKMLQREIWEKAVSATTLPKSHPNAGILLLPALNNMIDMATTRTMALRLHPPGIIYVLLFVLSLACALLAGYRMAAGQHRSWLHIFGFAFITVVTIYVILNIEYPRAGFIRLESPDQILFNIHDSLH